MKKNELLGNVKGDKSVRLYKAKQTDKPYRTLRREGRMSHPDINEIIHEHHGWDGKCFYDDTESTKDQDIINWLRSDNACLRGEIAVYEKFLKDRGYIKEEE